MKNEKKQYLAPEITVVPLNAADMFSSGNDALDNWSDDVFDRGHL